MSDSHGSESDIARNLKEGYDQATLKKLLSELPEFPIASDKVKQAYIANEWFTKFTGVLGACNLDPVHLDTDTLSMNLNYVQDKDNKPVSEAALREMKYQADTEHQIYVALQSQIVESKLLPVLTARRDATKLSLDATRKTLRDAEQKKIHWTNTVKGLLVNLQLTEIIFAAFRTKLPAEAKEKIRFQLESRDDYYTDALENEGNGYTSVTAYAGARSYDFDQYQPTDFTRLSIAFQTLKHDYGRVDATQRQLFKTHLGDPEISKMAQNTKVEHFRTQRFDPAVKMLRHTAQELDNVEYLTTLFLLIEHIPRFEGAIMMIKEKHAPFDDDTDIKDIYRRLYDADETYWRRQGTSAGPADTLAFSTFFGKHKVKSGDKIKGYHKEASESAGYDARGGGKQRDLRPCEWCKKCVLHKPSECYDNPANEGKPRVPFYKKESKPQASGGRGGGRNGGNGGGRGGGGRGRGGGNWNPRANAANKQEKENPKVSKRKASETDGADEGKEEPKPKSALKGSNEVHKPATTMVKFKGHLATLCGSDDEDGCDFRANVSNVDRNDPLNVTTVVDSGANIHTIINATVHMEDPTPSSRTIGFGDNNKLPIRESGPIGALQDVQVVDGMSVNLASANKIAVDNKMPIILTDTVGYMLYANSTLEFRAEDIALEFPVIDGLYQMDTAKFWRVMGADVPRRPGEQFPGDTQK